MKIKQGCLGKSPEELAPGDTVILVRMPHDREWFGIGKVAIPWAIGTKLEIVAVNHESKWLITSISKYAFPTCIFEHVPNE